MSELESEVKRLRANLDLLATERNLARQEADSWQATAWVMEQTRDAAVAERDRLRAEKAHLLEINAALRTRPDLGDRAPLVERLAEQRDRARKNVQVAVRIAKSRGKEIERLRGMLDLAIRQRKEAEAERDRAQARIRLLRQAYRMLHNDRKSFLAELDVEDRVVSAAQEVDRRVQDAMMSGAMVVVPPWFGELHDALEAVMQRKP